MFSTLSIKLSRKIFGYFLLICTISLIIYDPLMIFSIKDAINIIAVTMFIYLSIENKIIKTKLENSYEKQKQILENICRYCPDIIAYKDFNLRHIMCNKPFIDLINLNQDINYKGKNIFELAKKDIALQIDSNDKKSLFGKKISKYQINTDDGIFEMVCAPVFVQNNPVGIITIGKNITNEIFLGDRLTTKKEYQKSILDNLPFVAYLRSVDGKIITGNSKLAEYCNLPLEKIIGIDALEALTLPRDPEILKDDEIILNDKKPAVFEKELKIGTKNPGWYRIIKSPILNETKEIIGITVFISNIDNEKKIQAQKETFVATLTHDLKTPTIAQMRSVELLLNDALGKTSEIQKSILEQNLKSCKYMLGMISQVLNTYKFENGKTKLNKTEFDFTKLINECCLELLNLAESKNLKLSVKFDCKNPVISADEAQLKRVLINMISNSVSYAFKDSEIKIILKDEDDMFEFYTINSSPYIPSQILNRVFDKYTKAPSSAKFNKVGTGLGLYLSEQIIQAHGGKTIASSSENNENTFGFKIPKLHKDNYQIYETICV